MSPSAIATPHHCNTHHCQPTPLTTANLWHPLLPPTTTNHHWCHPPPASTTATTHHGGWQQWGTSVVGGNDGWQQMMGPVGGSGGWLSEKNFKIFFCSKWAKNPKKQHVLFLFYPYLGGGWVVQTQIWIHPYFVCFFYWTIPLALLLLLIFHWINMLLWRTIPSCVWIIPSWALYLTIFRILSKNFICWR